MEATIRPVLPSTIRISKVSSAAYTKQSSASSAQSLMLKKSGTPNNTDMPASIVVNTKLITKELAIEMAKDPLVAPFIYWLEMPKPVALKSAPPPLTIRKENKITPTEPTNVIRQDCETQTDLTAATTFATISIQCNLSDEFFWEDSILSDTTLSVEEMETEEKIKETFLKFVENNTEQHKTGKVECRLCREVERNMDKMEYHMSLHWGTPALCFACGNQFANETLFKRHRCPANEKHATRRNYKCPHYRCNVVAISSLELYDHINEHCDIKTYRCSGCSLRFTTADELRHHILIRKKCQAKRKRIRLPFGRSAFKVERICRKRVFPVYTLKKGRVYFKTFLSKRFEGIRRCQICLAHLSNDFKYSKHKQRCLRSYILRLKNAKSKLQKIEL